MTDIDELKQRSAEVQEQLDALLAEKDEKMNEARALGIEAQALRRQVDSLNVAIRAVEGLDDDAIANVKEALGG